MLAGALGAMGGAIYVQLGVVRRLWAPESAPAVRAGGGRGGGRKAPPPPAEIIETIPEPKPAEDAAPEVIETAEPTPAEDAARSHRNRRARRRGRGRSEAAHRPAGEPEHCRVVLSAGLTPNNVILRRGLRPSTSKHDRNSAAIPEPPHPEVRAQRASKDARWRSPGAPDFNRMPSEAGSAAASLGDEVSLSFQVRLSG